MSSSDKKNHPSCAACDLPIRERICSTDQGKGHKGCPTVTRKHLLEEANQKYEEESIHNFAHNASVQEADCYANRDQEPYVMQPSKTRIIEICEFAGKMGYHRLGLAFCLGLSREAKVVEDILSGYGFEVVSICCKAGNTSKDLLGIEEKDKIFKGKDEAMCNPIFQARALDAEGVDFTILLGLCVGHDTLFFQHIKSPTTVLAVKDRVTGHNPLAAIYQADSYYKKIRFPDINS